MFGALQPNRSRKATARSKSIPAPSGGLNAKDSIANMPETDAVTLDNFIPRPDRIEVRRGYIEHTTGITGAVQSIIPYVSPTVNKLFAAANNEIYDVTTAGAVGAASVTGLSNNKWQDTMFSTAGGNFLVICNGADSVRNFDGVSWTTPTITGVTSSNLINVNVFKFRLFFIEKNTMKFWFLPLNSIAGAASSFNLASIFKKGGYLVAMGTWTLDSGTGADDLAVFITSEGEVAVYQGTDPTDATRWGLVGVFTTSKPVGNRCFVKMAGDLVMITEAGFLPVSKSLYTDQTAPQLSISSKIERLVNKYTISSSDNFGWESEYFPTQNIILFNIPVVENMFSYQYVMDLSTKGWGRFANLNANCWAQLSGNLYYGADTVVCQALTGNNDNGDPIIATVKPAFNYFGSKGRQKMFSMMRPVLSLTGTVTASMGFATDFGDVIAKEQLIYDAATGSAWGSPWGSPWSIDGELQLIWHNTQGIGYSGTAKFIFTSSTSTSISLSAIDYLYRVGEYL